MGGIEQLQLRIMILAYIINMFHFFSFCFMSFNYYLSGLADLNPFMILSAIKELYLYLYNGESPQTLTPPAAEDAITEPQSQQRQRLHGLQGQASVTAIEDCVIYSWNFDQLHQLLMVHTYIYIYIYMYMYVYAYVT